MAAPGTRISTQRKTLVDEQGQRYTLSEEKGPARSFGMQFYVSFNEPYARMVKRIKSAPAMKVFAMLPQYLSFTEFRSVRQEDIATELDISQASVSKALNELAHLGAVERKGKGPTTQWRLSMEWGWQGTVAKYHQTKRERLEAKRPKLSVVSPPLSAA